MKLNIDCIREILLYAEKNLSYQKKDGAITKNSLFLNSICQDLNYPEEDIIYSINILEEEGYISAKIIWASGTIYDCIISAITPTGHEFINEIRDNRKWNKIRKTITENIKEYSVSAIKAIIEGITTATIKNIS